MTVVPDGNDESVRVDVGSGVVKVSLDGDAVAPLEKDADQESEAIGVSEFNAVASGVTLETESATDGVEVTATGTRGDVELPGVRQVSSSGDSTAGGETQAALADKPDTRLEKKRAWAVDNLGVTF